ncbi:MAG: orotidine-5'-phosphate decarboxylase [Nitrospirota bacterium]|jgi:orotidine-5'-phosphate decarboxylase
MERDRSRDAARWRLIFALDVGSAAEARELVRLLSPEVSFFKVGLELFFASGPALVKELVAEGLRVFLDIKLLDIATTVERAVHAAARLGVEVVTVHPDAAAVAAACRGRDGARPKIFVVTLLTSQTFAGGAATVAEMVGARAVIAAAAGADGVIAAGRHEEITAVRAASPGLQIICPGIRPAGVASGDQRRVVTPAEALQAGADYLVVGRPIRDADDPLAAARSIVAEMAQALGEGS